MKLSCSLAFASAIVSSTNAFAPAIRNRAALSNTRVFVATEPDSTTEEGENAIITSEINDDLSDKELCEKIGVAPEEIALGVSEKEFLQYIGTKDELIKKFKDDNPNFDDERANTEVAKFMMDAEMINAYISYKKNPPDLSAEMEQSLSDPKTLAQYAAFLGSGVGFGYLRKNIIQPKIDSGEWEYPHFPWEKADEAANAVAQASVDAIDATHGLFDTASDVLTV